MNKHNRQFTIKEIIAKSEITNQSDLVKALMLAGIEVTQATLSRDLREMGVVRANSAGTARYVLRSEKDDTRLKSLLGYEVTSIGANESMIVIKTLPGRAHGVAELIDSLEHPDILATIAGDNTVFIAPHSTRVIPKLTQTLRRFIAED